VKIALVTNDLTATCEGKFSRKCSFLANGDFPTGGTLSPENSFRQMFYV
jgi:hypothetical protein